MTIYFVNHSRHILVLNIDDGEPIFLQPFETMPIVRKESDTIVVSLKRNCESYAEKRKTIYHLILETKYCFSGVYDGEAFTISREKIQFSLNAYYDRLFLFASNATYLSENHRVFGEEKVKKTFSKVGLSDLLFDTFIFSPGALIVLIIIGIVLTLNWGWKFAIVYFPLALVGAVIITRLISGSVDVIGNKVFNIEDEKKEFYSYFLNDYIKNYYSNSQRTPFYKGKIEIN